MQKENVDTGYLRKLNAEGKCGYWISTETQCRRKMWILDIYGNSMQKEKSLDKGTSSTRKNILAIS